MLKCSKLLDTPVRHDNLSITKTSLRSRSRNYNTRQNSKFLIEKNGDNGGMSNEIETIGQTKLMLSSTAFKPAPLFSSKEKVIGMLFKQEEECDLVADADMSVTCVSGENVELKTPLIALNLPRISDVDMVENITNMVSKQRHSTPRDVKCLVKAVSSTPNHELNSSKLVRSVSTQTNLTLNAMELDELDDDIKSYIINVHKSDECSLNYSNQKSHINNSNEKNPSLRNFNPNKLLNYEHTPVQSKPSAIKKLSLRSKTMICSAIEKTKENSNIMPRYKSLEEKQIFSNTFSVMPQLKTPSPFAARVLQNPFEKNLQERLSQSIFSPNVFDNVVSPSEDSDLVRWTIEDISSINPVPIQEDFTFPLDEEDPEKESLVQQEIDRYFSETHCVMSPYESSQPSVFDSADNVQFNAMAAASTPQKVEIHQQKELKSANTQTAMSIPETLPVKLEESLKCHFQLYESDDFNLSSSNLRRKLFFHSEDEPPSPVMFENGEIWDNSPQENTRLGRRFTPIAGQDEFSSPEMSPVVLKPDDYKSKERLLTSCKKTLHLYFSGNPTNDVKESFFPGTKDLDSSGMITIEGKGRKSRPSVDSESNSCSDTGVMSYVDNVSCTSSAMPPSQDTGYQTEDSWPPMALTPSRQQ